MYSSRPSSHLPHIYWLDSVVRTLLLVSLPLMFGFWTTGRVPITTVWQRRAHWWGGSSVILNCFGGINRKSMSTWPSFFQMDREVLSIGIFFCGISSSVRSSNQALNLTKKTPVMHSLRPKPSWIPSRLGQSQTNGKWIEIGAFHLVPDDVVSLEIGVILPAYCRLTESFNVSIDQAALTGELLPQNKKVGDECFRKFRSWSVISKCFKYSFYSGSRCKQGEVKGSTLPLAPKLFSVALASLERQDDATTLLQVLAKNSRTSWSLIPFSYRYRRACILDW